MPLEALKIMREKIRADSAGRPQRISALIVRPHAASSAGNSVLRITLHNVDAKLINEIHQALNAAKKTEAKGAHPYVAEYSACSGRAVNPRTNQTIPEAIFQFNLNKNTEHEAYSLPPETAEAKLKEFENEIRVALNDFRGSILVEELDVKVEAPPEKTTEKELLQKTTAPQPTSIRLSREQEETAKQIADGKLNAGAIMDTVSPEVFAVILRTATQLKQNKNRK